jgi:hypothetical protein
LPDATFDTGQDGRYWRFSQADCRFARPRLLKSAWKSPRPSSLSTIDERPVHIEIANRLGDCREPVAEVRAAQRFD